MYIIQKAPHPNGSKTFQTATNKITECSDAWDLGDLFSLHILKRKMTIRATFRNVGIIREEILINIIKVWRFQLENMQEQMGNTKRWNFCGESNWNKIYYNKNRHVIDGQSHIHNMVQREPMNHIMNTWFLHSETQMERWMWDGKLWGDFQRCELGIITTSGIWNMEWRNSQHHYGWGFQHE